MSEKSIIKIIGMVCLATVAVTTMIMHASVQILGGCAALAYFLILFL